MVMIPNYEFKMKLPIYETNLLSTKKIDQKTHDTLIQKILAYPDVMKRQTNRNNKYQCVFLDDFSLN